MEGEETENKESAGGKVRSAFVALRMSGGQAKVVARRPVGADGRLGGIAAFARPREIGIDVGRGSPEEALERAFRLAGAVPAADPRARRGMRGGPGKNESRSPGAEDARR